MLFFIHVNVSLSWRPVKMSQKEGSTASYFWCNITVSFQTLTLCLTDAFHGGCFFFQYFCALYIAFSFIMYVRLSDDPFFFGPDSNALLLKDRVRKTTLCPFGRVQWLKDTTPNLCSQAFHSSNYYKKEGRVTGEIEPGQLLLRAALVTTYRRQIVVAITPNRGQTTTTRRLNSEVPRVRYTKATTSVSAFMPRNSSTEEIAAHTNIYACLDPTN